MKPISEMTRAEMESYAEFTCGLTKSEIAAEFKTDGALRKFLEESAQLRGMISDEAAEKKIGWDSEDTTRPDDAINAVGARKKKKLSQSIKRSGGKVSVGDVQAALDAFNDGDDEDDPAHN